MKPESSHASASTQKFAIALSKDWITNAYKDAAQNNGKVVSCSVTLKAAVCPECGRSYIAGGTTSTQIKYYNEDNPYQKDLKQTDGLKYAGMNADYAI